MVSSIPDLTWSATAGTWSQNYTYDNFGNLTGTNGAAVWSFDPATNHPSGTGTTDNNGNSLANSNVWDVENRLVSTLNANGYQTMTYQYDPWGKRISQTVGSFASSKTIYFYSITGQRLQTFLCTSDDGNGNPRCLLQQSDVYFGRKLILAGTSPSGVSPVATDRLGSIRYNSAGNLSYYPYGQEHSQPTTQDNTDKFATYFRDWVGQDYADQRYYNQAGRFFTPDPGGLRSADPSNPGSWNRYAYVKGDPINGNDPKGLGIWDFIKSVFGGGDGSDDPEIEDYPGDWGGGSTSCGGDTFSPSPDPSCYAPVPAPVADEPATPQCDLQMYTRPVAGLTGLVASHQYVVINDASTGDEWTVEGQRVKSQSGGWGTLKAAVTENGYAYAADNPAKNQTWGPDLLFDCSQVNHYVSEAQSFQGTAYYPSGPNSNSYMHWYVGAANLTMWYQNPPPGSIGWWATIPGN